MSGLLEKNSSSNTLIIGSIIQDRYQILSKIKGGALSRTYLAQDLSQPNEPRCILKHYPYNKEVPRLYKTNMRLFLKEAKHLQVLSVHPQIPRLIDYFGLTDQGWYLIQELVEGKLLNNTFPMSEYSENCWSVYKVAKFMHDVCETLQFIHSQKIIHCDLKPNNLIRRAKDDRIVMIDFGSAQYVPGFQGSSEDISIASLRTKITVSPSGYLAPEQTVGQPQVNSDFYALGVMAIQAWTGLDPARMKKDSHTGELVWDQYVKIDDIEACRQLVAIISRMVQPDVGDRYGSAKELLEELDIFVAKFPEDVEEEIQIDYEKISFADSTLFQKPDDFTSSLGPSKSKSSEDTELQELFDEVILPPEASKDTFIQDDMEDSLFANESVLSEDELDFEDSPIPDSSLELNNLSETSDLHTEDLPQKFKRPKKKSKFPKMALIGISVVVVNGILISLGLQHLIKNMATADTTPQPNDDFLKAQDAYAQGDLPEAIAIAQAIPQQHPDYQAAQQNLSQWEQEFATQGEKIVAVTTAHAAGDWQTVVSEGKTLQSNPEGADLIKGAQFEIDVAAYQRVQKAFDLATNFEFDEALATLNDAPPNSKFANVITDKLAEYENKKVVRNQYYLQQAVNHAEAREFSEAVAFLEQIPSDSVHSELAEIKIVEYTEKQEIKEAYERWAAANKQKKEVDTNAARFVQDTPMARNIKLQPARLLTQINPGAIWQGIA